MTTDYTYSWHTIERGIFEYFQRVLGTVEGITGYTEETFPRTIASDAAGFYIFKFSMNGGGNPVIRQTRTQVINGAWTMNGEVKAICSDDYTAKLVGGMCFNACPINGTDIDGLSLAYATEHPSRERELVKVASDERAGDEQIFYVVTLPLVVAFGNVERIE